MNRENLQKLADGLRGELAAEFSMKWFCCTDDGEPADVLAVIPKGCGTAACAIGHATYLVAPKEPDEDLFSYSERIFGTPAYGAETDVGVWRWCFSGDWTYRDNTPTGAADRIEWLLRNGVPGDAREQRLGLAPLCYRSADPQQ